MAVYTLQRTQTVCAHIVNACLRVTAPAEVYLRIIYIFLSDINFVCSNCVPYWTVSCLFVGNPHYHSKRNRAINLFAVFFQRYPK